MEYIVKSHRYGELILEQKFPELWEEIKSAIESISDDEIIKVQKDKYSKQKSLSKALNFLIKEKLVGKGWTAESHIFQYDKEDTEGIDYKAYKRGAWRLDFAKEDVSIEVAFNHGGDIAWNLLKPVLSAEVNHVAKAQQTRVGIVICATEELKKAGGFDSAIGFYEKINTYLLPLSNYLTVPVAIVGLKAPRTFDMEVIKDKDKKNRGHIRRLK
jgi:hypothetical protein